MRALCRIPCMTHVHKAQGAVGRWVDVAIYLPHASSSILVNNRFRLRIVERSRLPLAKRAQVVKNGLAGPRRNRKHRGSHLAVCSDSCSRASLPARGAGLQNRSGGRLREGGIDVWVVLAGSTVTGYEWYETELRAPLRSAGFLEDEALVGSEKIIGPLLEDCDRLIVPYRLDEPLGNTAVESVLSPPAAHRERHHWFDRSRRGRLRYSPAHT